MGPESTGAQYLLRLLLNNKSNVSSQLTFSIDLNSNDKTGFIDEVSIAYKCWDPNTGLENTGCQLAVKK